MESRIQCSTVIATSPPTTEALELPLTIFDGFACRMHIAIIFAFSAPAPSNYELIKSLSRTLLLHFPRLTAGLGGDPHNPFLFFGGSEGGALLVEAIVDFNLDDYMLLQPSPELARLHPNTTSASISFMFSSIGFDVAASLSASPLIIEFVPGLGFKVNPAKWFSKVI
ncbi:hypothetical protein IEQ34_005574 [Dendrobium chrysotoxum]|uniref:Uncharacterized protein n=1 Tax=Dendrobium chrysotoxum TaxID=161865 RepID=A0AAV7HA60_DENCH|nr:hypothetical protein IEQ34_005574 [Dendrobium chrysotoxum]